MDDDLGIVLAPPGTRPVMKGFPFADGALLSLRTAILSAATVRRGDLDRHLALVPRLPPELQKEADGWTVLVAARAGESIPEDPLDPDDLSDRERGVLREHAEKLRSSSSANLYQAFWRAGLFAYRDSNERALGIDPPGALDRRSQGRPLWWWAHGARSSRIPFEHWLEVLRGPDALAALEDAANAPYELYRDRFRSGNYDVGALIDVIERSASALGLASELLSARIATLRENARNTKVTHGKGGIPWP